MTERHEGSAHRLVYLCLQHNRPGQASATHVAEIVNGLRRLGWSVELFEPKYHAGSVPSTLRRVLACVAVQVRAVPDLVAADAVYIRSHVLALPAQLLARVLRRPIVIELNGIPSEAVLVRPRLRPLRGVINWMARAQMRTATAVVAVTDALADWASTNGALRAVVIPNGANVDLFQPGGTPAVVLPRRYAVFFGAFAPWQGVAQILEAVNLPAWPPGVAMVFAGDGVERALVEEAARLDQVMYLGTVPYTQLAPIVAGAVCGLSPQNDVGARSRYGLSPLKVYETLACGTPVVVSDAPGQADLVREGDCGIVVPIGDPEAIARAVAALASNPTRAKELGQRGRDLIVRFHSWAARAATTDELLRGVVHDGGRAARRTKWETTNA